MYFEVLRFDSLSGKGNFFSSVTMIMMMMSHQFISLNPAFGHVTGRYTKCTVMGENISTLVTCLQYGEMGHVGAPRDTPV